MKTKKVINAVIRTTIRINITIIPPNPLNIASIKLTTISSIILSGVSAAVAAGILLCLFVSILSLNEVKSQEYYFIL